MTDEFDNIHHKLTDLRDTSQPHNNDKVDPGDVPPPWAGTVEGVAGELVQDSCHVVESKVETVHWILE